MKYLTFALLLLVLISCNYENKPGKYYYSDQQYDSSEDMVDVVDPYNDSEVHEFLNNKVLSYKNYRLTIDDSLHADLKKDGNNINSGYFQIKPYMLSEERMLILHDTITNKEVNFTLSEKGRLTDRSSYIIYSPE